MASGVLRWFMTALFTVAFSAIYFQAIGPATGWWPFGGSPNLLSGQAGLIFIIAGALSYGLAILIHFDLHRGWVKKPRLVVQQ